VKTLITIVPRIEKEGRQMAIFFMADDWKSRGLLDCYTMSYGHSFAVHEYYLQDTEHVPLHDAQAQALIKFWLSLHGANGCGFRQSTRLSEMRQVAE
jgi:hypothetical protein